MINDQKLVWKALADSTRRSILDLLRKKEYTVGEISQNFDMTRIAIMKHLKILEKANLVFDKKKGREHWYKLNVIPIEEIYNRWIRSYEKIWASSLINLKNIAEQSDETMEMKWVEIEQIAEISTNKEMVYTILTSNIRDWWGKPYVMDTKATNIILEPKLGGILYETWDTNGGYKWGEVSALQKGELIEITGPLAMSKAIYGKVSFILTENNGKTKVHLSHKAYGELTEEDRERYTNGWKNLIGLRLKKLAEEGIKMGFGEKKQ